MPQPGPEPAFAARASGARRTEEDAVALAKMDGNLLILGASGKMGPTMVRLARGVQHAAAVGRADERETRRSDTDPVAHARDAVVEVVVLHVR